MLVHINARHFDLTPALSNYVESKVRLMLGRYKNKIVKISVSLSDINGPKGGEDKCCKIIVKPESTSSIVVQETAANMYDAINSCSHRVKRTVNRSLSITQWKRKKFVSKREVEEEPEEVQSF